MKRDFKNKRVSVVGLARSGMAAALLLKRRGAQVCVTDSGESAVLRKNAKLLYSIGIKVELGGHTRRYIKGSHLIVTSPGVDSASPAIGWAVEEGIPIISEVELGYLHCDAPIVAVTGTNGKSTVTALIGHLLKSGGRDAIVCGNFGNPFCGEIDKIRDDTIIVLEASSFQLERVKEFKPFVSVLLNVSQNHFDRHPDLGAYIEAKAQIFRNQGEKDFAVLNYDDELVRRFDRRVKARVLYFSRSQKVNGAFLDGGQMKLSIDGVESPLCEASQLKLKGGHNIENVLAGLCVARILGMDYSRTAQALKYFKGLEHRFEYVVSIDGIDFINDSKSTTVLSTTRALEACDRPVILIAGGKDKGSDFTTARTVIASRVKKMILIGVSKDKIKKGLSGAVEVLDADGMEDAVRLAYFNAQKGDCVLLSPMCASFDMFENFEERGRVFKEAVVKIQGTAENNIKLSQ